MSAVDSPVGVVVVACVVSVVLIGGEVTVEDEEVDDDVVGTTDGDGRGGGDALGPGPDVRVVEAREVDVGGVVDRQVRCRSANHAGAPWVIASSGQVIRYMEMPRSACQRPPPNDTQNGSPECSLAITAHPLPQSMMRAPLPG